MSRMLTRILDKVEPAARDLQYKREGLSFTRLQREVLVVASYQGSMNSTKDELKFTVNLSAYVVQLVGSDWKKCEPHWTERIGYMLPAQDDIWWKISEPSLAASINEQVKLFVEVIDPSLCMIGTLSYIIDSWRTGESGWTSPMVRNELLDRARREGLT